jgi:membrane protease YdiL (CAAX protease family)
MNLFTTKPSIIEEAENAQLKPHFMIQLLIFVLVFFIGQIGASIPVIVATVRKVLQEEGGLDPNTVTGYATNMPQDLMLVSLFSTLIATILTIVYCRFIEKRSLHSIGFVKKKGVSDYFLGLLIGLILFSFSVLIAYLTGSVEFNGLNPTIPYGIILLFLIAFIIQGMSEEVILRGYLMVSLSTKIPVIAAILINSLIFSVLHFTNPGASPLAALNIALFGIFASIFALKSDSLWGVCGIHSAWNFVQGNFFGFKVSGLDTTSSILSFSASEAGSLFNGGSFGMEGGLGVTITLALGIFIVLFIKGKNSKVV